MCPFFIFPIGTLEEAAEMKSGVLDPASCAGATPSSINGPCADAYYAVYGATKATAPPANRDAVAGDFFAKATATGMANNLYSCDVTKACFSSFTCP